MNIIGGLVLEFENTVFVPVCTISKWRVQRKQSLSNSAIMTDADGRTREFLPFIQCRI
jgi:hypothetical protein